MNNTLKDVFKSILVGALVLLITVLPFIPHPEIPGMEPMPDIYLIPVFLIYTLAAFVYSKIRKNLKMSRQGVFFTIFSFHFIISAFLISVEGEFYLEIFPFLLTLLYGLILSLAISASMCYLWKHEGNGEAGLVRSYFASRSVFSWVWRVISSMLLFFVFTMIIGIISMSIVG